MVTGMFHALQSTTIRPRRTLPDSLPHSPPLQWILFGNTQSSLGKASLPLLRSCTPSDYIFLRQLCTQQRDRISIWIYTRKTSNSDKSHYNMNSWIYISLTTINNAYLSRNSKHIRLLQERTSNSRLLMSPQEATTSKGGNHPWRLTRQPKQPHSEGDGVYTERCDKLKY